LALLYITVSWFIIFSQSLSIIDPCLWLRSIWHCLGCGQTKPGYPEVLWFLDWVAAL